MDGLVVVWALVDLGFRLLASHPLVLGRLDEARKRTGKGWGGWKVFPPRPNRKSPAPPKGPDTASGSEREDATP